MIQHGLYLKLFIPVRWIKISGNLENDNQFLVFHYKWKTIFSRSKIRQLMGVPSTSPHIYIKKAANSIKYIVCFKPTLYQV